MGDDPIEVVSGAGYTQGGFTRMTDLTDVQKNAIHQYKDRLVGLLEDAMANSSSFWNQQVNNDPGTFTLKLIKDAARQFQAGRSLHSTGSFHASKSKVKVVPRCDRFGTDYTTVDRMANPYRPGTVPHKDWMMAWVEAQYHWKTDQFKAHYAEVTEARDAMIESCAPVANWVDEVLFEVAEAREECENLEDPDVDGLMFWVDEILWGDTSPAVAVHSTNSLLIDDIDVKVVDNWHLSMIIPPLSKESITKISVV